MDSSKQSLVNRHIHVDRAPVVALTAQLRDLETKQLEAKDKERDSNIDIYQLAMTYQRKVEEFESLLNDYSGDSADVTSQIRTLKVELSATQALTNIEQCKVETFKE